MIMRIQSFLGGMDKVERYKNYSRIMLQNRRLVVRLDRIRRMTDGLTDDECWVGGGKAETRERMCGSDL